MADLELNVCSTEAGKMGYYQDGVNGITESSY